MPSPDSLDTDAVLDKLDGALIMRKQEQVDTLRRAVGRIEA